MLRIVDVRGVAAASGRALTGLALLGSVLVAPLAQVPTAAHAEAAEVDLDDASQVAAAAPYLNRLLEEINERREAVGTGPLELAPQGAIAAVTRHTADLTGTMLSKGACGHGVGSPARYSWDYVADSGFDGDGRGEVIACPGPEGYWTPEKIADGWWDSPSHHKVLYADPTVNAVACGTHNPSRGGAAYQTIVCTTFRT